MKTKTNKFSGDAAKARRVELGLSRPAVAYMMSQEAGRGFTHDHIRKWEMDGITPSADNMMLLAKALNVEPAFFYQAS